MKEETRKFIESLYSDEREWKDKEIVDVMVYYNDDRYSVKYMDDTVYIYDPIGGEYVRIFHNYEEFVKQIEKA